MSTTNWYGFRPSTADLASVASYATVTYLQNMKISRRDLTIKSGIQLGSVLISKNILWEKLKPYGIEKLMLNHDGLYTYDFMTAALNVSINSMWYKKDSKLEVVLNSVGSNTFGRYLRQYLPAV